MFQPPLPSRVVFPADQHWARAPPLFERPRLLAAVRLDERFHFAQNRGVGPRSTRRRATRGAGNRDASRPPPSNASHAATIARRDDQASPARVQTRGAHRRRVVALALGVFAEWKRAHGEEFPRGARAWKRAPRAPSMGYPNTSGSRTRGSRRARRRRAVSRTPWVWTRARGGSERGGDQGETVHLTRRGDVRSVQSALRRVRAVPHGRTDEDDPSRNHRRQPSTDAREAKGGA